jgi:hypothetical protein
VHQFPLFPTLGLFAFTHETETRRTDTHQGEPGGLRKNNSGASRKHVTTVTQPAGSFSSTAVVLVSPEILKAHCQLPLTITAAKAFATTCTGAGPCGEWVLNSAKKVVGEPEFLGQQVIDSKPVIRVVWFTCSDLLPAPSTQRILDNEQLSTV